MITKMRHANDKPFQQACGTFRTGAQNTTKQAGNLPDSEVFSRPEFKVLGVGIAYPQGRRHNLFCVLNPHTHSACLKSTRNGFQFNKEPETMTKVPSPRTSPVDNITSQQAIENALSMALYFMRLPRTPSAIRAATGRANRALTLLKTACTDTQTGGAA